MRVAFTTKVTTPTPLKQAAGDANTNIYAWSLTHMQGEPIPDEKCTNIYAWSLRQMHQHQQEQQEQQVRQP